MVLSTSFLHFDLTALYESLINININMGCASSVTTTSSSSPLTFSNLGSMGSFSPTMKRRRSTSATMTSADCFEGRRMINKREGNPSQFSQDGYDIGLRVRV